MKPKDTNRLPKEILRKTSLKTKEWVFFDAKYLKYLHLGWPSPSIKCESKCYIHVVKWKGWITYNRKLKIFTRMRWRMNNHDVPGSTWEKLPQYFKILVCWPKLVRIKLSIRITICSGFCHVTLPNFSINYFFLSLHTGSRISAYEFVWITCWNSSCRIVWSS